MVYYSAPVTPAVTKALVLPNTSDPTNPQVHINVGGAGYPDNGTAGQYANKSAGRQQIISYAGGSASYHAPIGQAVTTDDCNNVAHAISDAVTPRDARPTIHDNMQYTFSIQAGLAGDVSGNGWVPAYVLPEWPAAKYGASLENRPTFAWDSNSGPWNPRRDDPNANPPATEIGWEIVEPGWVESTYLVRWSYTQRNDADPVPAYINLTSGVQGGDWNAATAQYDGTVERPRFAEWVMPPAGSPWVWDTDALDVAALPQTAYVLNSLYRQPPGYAAPWTWRFDPTVTRSGSFEATVDLTVIYMWHPPVYRWILSEPAQLPGTPPLRQFPRRDGLAASTARRHYPPDRSVQASNRHRGGFY